MTVIPGHNAPWNGTNGIVKKAVKSTASNPVADSAEYALEQTNIVQLNEAGIKSAARHIYQRLQAEHYTPRTWRTHPLHLCPREPLSVDDASTKRCLDWIFLVSSLNFSFWSEKQGEPDQYGVEWRAGWDADDDDVEVHTGYWSLVASINRAMDEGVPIISPAFYSSKLLCPDALLARVFRPAAQSSETMPLLQERIQLIRENGMMLCMKFGGTFKGFYEEFVRRYDGRGTALQMVQMIAETFPTFRDETELDGRKVYFWKRAQILVAEIWAAFHPASSSQPHPIFPHGADIQQLTMFADYRVPQVLHHLRILEYPTSLVGTLKAGEMLPYGSREEQSIRAASIVGVERLREEMIHLSRGSTPTGEDEDEAVLEVSSVLIDFYLWDLAKRIERGEESIQGLETVTMLPAHRTRSIWY